MIDLSLQIHEEILKQLGTEWAKVTTDFSNQIVEEAEELDSELNDRIREVVERYVGEVKLDADHEKPEVNDES